MSTLKTSNIQHASAASAAITLDANGQATLNGLAYPTAGSLSNRNLIINGAMQVAQRGTQVTGVTAGGYRTCDRLQFAVTNLGTWTVDQDTNAPNGFSNSFKVTCTTADASPAAADNLRFLYLVEAQDLQSLGFGTSGAQALTLSFWVRSNKTGNASFGILQVDNSNKQVSFQYNISSADTWEYKTISIPGDTAGVISNDNGAGFQLEWWLNGGSDYSGGSHQSTWSTFAQTNRNPSNLGVGGATSDYFQITGVQLEVGSVATPFEHRSYGDELQRCQRYFYKWQRENGQGQLGQIQVYSSTQAWGRLLVFPVRMRSSPTFSSSGTFRFFNSTLNTGYDVTWSTTYLGPTQFGASVSGGSGLTAGHCSGVYANADGDYLHFNAEL